MCFWNPNWGSLVYEVFNLEEKKPKLSPNKNTHSKNHRNLIAFCHRDVPWERALRQNLLANGHQKHKSKQNQSAASQHCKADIVPEKLHKSGAKNLLDSISRCGKSPRVDESKTVAVSGWLMWYLYVLEVKTEILEYHQSGSTWLELLSPWPQQTNITCINYLRCRRLIWINNYFDMVYRLNISAASVIGLKVTAYSTTPPSSFYFLYRLVKDFHLRTKYVLAVPYAVNSLKRCQQIDLSHLLLVTWHS